MPKQPETLLKEKVLLFLHGLPNTWFVKTQERSTRGIPDILVCVNGLFVAMELKKDAKAIPDKLQLYVLQKIKAAGGLAMLVYPENWEEAMETLTEIALSER
jgi:hypothetical protein